MTNNELRIVFSKNLNEILSAKKMSQRELAIAMDTTDARVSQYCSGARVPRANVCIDIAHVLDVKLSDLLEERQESADRQKAEFLLSKINEESLPQVCSILATFL